MASLISASSSLLLILVSVHFCRPEYVAPTFFARFDGNFRDLAGNVPDATVIGDAGFTTGPYGYDNTAVNLDGVDDAITFHTPSDVTLFAQDHTIIMWVRAGGAIGCIICFTNGNDIRTEIWNWDGNDELFVRYMLSANDNYEKSDLGGVLTTDKWILLSLTYESSTGFHRIYLDGAEFLRWTTSYPSDFWLGPLRIGQRKGNDHHFGGRLACLQVYDQVYSQREISQAETLCKPAYTALNPWPQPLGLWSFDSTFKLFDLSKQSNLHHGTITGTTYYDIGPRFQPHSSAEFRSEAPTFFDLDNSNRGLSPLNSMSFSAWIYLVDGLDFPLFQYEYGTETAGTQNWALHIWILTSRRLFICLGDSDCLLSSHQGVLGRWNHFALSFDFYRAKVHFYVNGEKTTHDTGQTAVLKTALADGVRIGKSFYAPDARYSHHRLACVQVYDVNFLDHEILALQYQCSNVHKTQQGAPDDLVLVYSFHAWSRCRSSSPKLYEMTNSSGDSILCEMKAGFRMKEGESAAINHLHPVYLTDMAVLEPGSPFTMMFYIRLEYGADATVGFDGGPKVMFTGIESGLVNFTLSFGSASEETTFPEFHNLNDSQWLHVAIACGEIGECYVFRNSTYLGNAYLRPSIIKNTDQRLKIESFDSEIRLSCFQLYKRRLSQTEVETSSSRCFKKATPNQHPVPVGLWPMDSKYQGMEATRRNNDIDFVETDGCLWEDDTPFDNFSRGSLLLQNTADGAAKCLGQIESNVALDVRHTFTWMAYVMPIAGESAAALFAYDGPEWGMPIYLVFLNTDAPKFHWRALEFLAAERVVVEFDKWQVLAVQCDYGTGLCRQWIDYQLLNELMIVPGEISTNNRVNIGNHGSWFGKVKMTCVQLYDEALTGDQMRSAMQRCNYETQVGSSYTKPVDVPQGYTRVNSTRTFNDKTQLQCLAACSTSSDCFSVNYFVSTKTCELSADIYDRKSGLVPFEETDGVYLEFVHPIVAEGY